MERVDKRLAGTGRWSRKEVKALIRAGRVTAGGVQVRRPEEKTTWETELRVDGVPIAAPQFTYLMLNKPAGVLSATEDRRQKTVLDLLPAHLRDIGLFPAGRLDKDAEGLLLLTNDGGLAHNLLAPGKGVDKVYYVRVDGTPDADDAAAFAAGMTLPSGERCLPAGLKALDAGEALVTLREGKFHQVKRMLAARGKPVFYLKRLSVGPLALDENLAAGGWRELTAEEAARLLSAF